MELRVWVARVQGLGLGFRVQGTRSRLELVADRFVHSLEIIGNRLLLDHLLGVLGLGLGFGVSGLGFGGPSLTIIQATVNKCYKLRTYILIDISSVG